MKKTAKKSIWSWLPGLLISLVAIFLLVRFTNWDEIKSALASIRLEVLLLGVFITIIWLLIRAVAWRTLLNGKTSIGQAFRIINIGYLLNTLFPLRAGELGRALIMGKATGMGMMKVLPTIVVERAFDLACAAICMLVTLPLVVGMDWVGTVAMITLALVIFGLLLLYWMGRNQEKVENWFTQLSKRSKLVHKWIMPQISNLLDGLKLLTNPKQYITSLLLIGSSWVLGMTLYYVVLKSMQPNAEFWWGTFINSVLAMGIAIPSAPSSLGVFEAAIVGGLSLLSVKYSIALGYAVVMHFLQIANTSVLGIIGLAMEGISLNKIFQESQESEPPEEFSSNEVEQ